VASRRQAGQHRVDLNYLAVPDLEAETLSHEPHLRSARMSDILAAWRYHQSTCHKGQPGPNNLMCCCMRKRTYMGALDQCMRQ